MSEISVPKALKTWFVIHFAADILFAVPLMFFPVAFLQMLGWEVVDPVAARIAAAALFGIGIESFLGRNAPVSTFKGMLRLKIIWSAAAILGFALSLLQGAQGRPVALWLVLLIFVAFNVLWVYWLRRIKRL
jgi:hypothetical protein